MKKILTAILLFIFIQSSYGCINMYKTLITGEVVEDDYIGGVITPQFSDLSESDFKNSASEYYNKYKQSGDIENLSDYASLLAFQGKYKEAKDIFISIEKTHPSLYSSATNLGTVYELLGEIDSAYYWIKKGIEINPTSHHSSEWIHLRVLEYLMDSTNLKNNSIVRLNFGSDSLPIPPAGFNLYELEQMLYHQLHERLFFSIPPNKIVAYLYFDYANTIVHTMSLEEALEAYSESKRFGLKDSILDLRITALKAKTKVANPSNTEKTRARTIATPKSNNWIFIGIGALLFAIVLWVIIKKRK